MTDPIQEQISAFHDGELVPAEAELLLKRLERDPQLRATVGRYALIGDALRATEAGGPSRDFAVQVSKAIERESIPARVWRPVASWLKPVAGGAIAAGVAAVALVSLRIAPLDQPAAIVNVEREAPVLALDAPPERTTISTDAPPQYTVPMNSPTRTAPPMLVVNDGRLANFVMAHSEYSSPLDRRNVLTGLLVEDPATEQGEPHDGQPVILEPAKR